MKRREGADRGIDGHAPFRRRLIDIERPTTRKDRQMCAFLRAYDQRRQDRLRDPADIETAGDLLAEMEEVEAQRVAARRVVLRDQIGLLQRSKQT
jgi:hypothetical protein